MSSRKYTAWDNSDREDFYDKYGPEPCKGHLLRKKIQY